MKSGVNSSGYPLLSPTSTTLVQAMLNMLYQVQHKQPWKRAITNVSTLLVSGLEYVLSHVNSSNSSQIFISPIPCLA